MLLMFPFSKIIIMYQAYTYAEEGQLGIPGPHGHPLATLITSLGAYWTWTPRSHLGPLTIIAKSLDHISIRMHASRSPLRHLDGTRLDNQHSD